ncbi:maltooligosyl trehalose synthase [Roseiarcus fermentans]|uniref:Maltooligosyl trehalose synthase n=1 Tax=Roseiarcus fermentans TaxID=1473586 RepID=A0A366FHH1_9HYPH|nr:malto-oligosyltrehalose synthase [Roseiarcus fermentans]RBP14051.1 maltooligosyl trehalose synthase [Roseiarcus fermentans]
MTPPRATYRLQLRENFGFADAGAIAPYLARLGVSHAYLSPIFKARPGSAHGYDITDHAELNPELGTEADYAGMIASFRREGVGVVLDIVPNHMGVGGADNPLWLDVLEWGEASPKAGWFDIDWSVHRGPNGGRLLAPVLGEPYGEALRTGKLALKFDAEAGTFAVWAYDTHKLPVAPPTYPMILGREREALEWSGDRFRDLPNWRPQVAERARVLEAELVALVRDDADAREAVAARVAAINGDWRELDRLIEAQFWRVAFFRVAEDEINYRRFFNINDLAGLRIELAPVFAHAHARVFAMLGAGEIDGLRIDHIDGLFDPKAYLVALREQADRPFYLVVEKILAPHEALRADWPVEGSTGYDFVNLALGLLIDPAAEGAFDDSYRGFAGARQTFAAVAVASKLRIMDHEMASELAALGRAAARLAKTSPLTVDLTRGILVRAIRLILAHFPVYRTYLDLGGTVDEADLRDVAWAIARARRGDPDLHPSAFDVLAAALTSDAAALRAKELGRTASLRFAMRFQQASGPVMAKGVEDTAFYRFNRFLALNEVGGTPDRFGVAPAAFHKAVAQRAGRWPHAMLATATHDTKRGEDSRARLAVLSERPDEWRRQVAVWSRLLRARIGDVEGVAAPDRNDEYMLYQMLVGSWPPDMLDNPSADALAAFADRIRGALTKSMREAKLNSGWAAPNAAYEGAALAFASEALRPDAPGFLSAFLPFVADVARLGVQNSLVQTVLKFCAPGVPDTYQGTELWDFSLVDPDNRRPVDYGARGAALETVGGPLASSEARARLFASLMETWRDGRVKLATIALLLSLRRERPDLFAEGDYRPLEFSGAEADWGFGFVREHGGRRLVMMAARYPAKREAKPDWEAAALLPEGRWFDHVRGRAVEGGAPLRTWLGALPAAVLTEA